MKISVAIKTVFVYIMAEKGKDTTENQLSSKKEQTNPND